MEGRRVALGDLGGITAVIFHLRSLKDFNSASGGRIWTRCFQLCSRLSEDAVSADHAVVALSRADPFEVSGHPWSSGWRGKDVDGKESQRASKGGK